MVVQYVPILKWKQGEQGALLQMSESDRDRIKPLMEIMPLPESMEEDERKAYEYPYEKETAKIKNCWGNLPFFWDMTSHLIPCISDENVINLAPLKIMHKFFEKEGCRPTHVFPVLVGSESHKILGNFVLKSLNGELALRVTEEDLLEDDFADNLVSLIDTSKLLPAKIDIIMDLENLERAKPKANAISIKGYLELLPQLEEWRSIIIAGTSFPDSLMGVEKGITRIKRVNWKTWLELKKMTTKNFPRLIFADYGVSGVLPPPDFQPYMQPSTNIRYTTDDEWVVLKGSSFRKHGGAEFTRMAKELVALPEYKGSNYSWGDEMIELCAIGTKHGNPSTWRKIGTSHHIAFVLDQLANLP